MILRNIHVCIGRAFYNLDIDLEKILKRKFDISYFISKENLAFTKMQPLCELLERQGVDLGQGYKLSLIHI